MKTITLLEPGTDYPIIGTVILTGDPSTDVGLITEACKEHFNRGVAVNPEIDWDGIKFRGRTDVRLTLHEDVDGDYPEQKEVVEAHMGYTYSKPKFYLFGEYVVRQHEQGYHDNVVEGLIECDGTLQAFDSLHDPTKVIDACEGWDSLCEITEKEYKMYEEAINTNQNQ